MKVCAIVPTCNRPESLTECLEALLAQTRALDALVVVDNGSDDATQTRLQERFGAQVIYLPTPENLGSAGGFHEGMKFAWENGYDWIWCMDDDAFPRPDTLEKLLQAAADSKAPVAAVVCARRDPATGKKFRLGEIVDVRKRRNVALGEKDWIEKTIPVDIAPWAGLLVEASAARLVGYPQQGMFAWYDDSLFTYRLKRFGAILHVGAAELLHPYETSAHATRRRYRRLAAQDYWKQYYLVRNGYMLKKALYGTAWATFSSLADYLRSLGSIAFLDDRKLYRLRILTKGVLDGFFSRLGNRVSPGPCDLGNRAEIWAGPSALSKETNS